MNFSVQRNILLDALVLVSGAVEKRHTLPILSNFLFSFADNNIITITATDLEVELVTHVAADSVSELKDITLPARKLVDICKSLPEGSEIKFSLNNQRVSVTSGRSRFTLATLNTAEFPKIGEIAIFQQFKISQLLLKKLLEKTFFSMAQQDVRYYLNGLLLDVSANLIRIVATDGHRLAMALTETNLELEHNSQIILPRKGALELLRLLEDSDTEIEIKMGANHLQAVSDRFMFTSKLIDGKFPDYNRVIPKDMSYVLNFEKESLKCALQRSAILCNEKYHGVKLKFNEKLLDIIANNPEQEQAEETIELDTQVNNVEIAFNVKYLIDALNSIDSDQVKISLKDSNSSILLEQQTYEDYSHIYVVMPMRL